MRIPEEQVVPCGREIYERSVRPELRPEDQGKFVVIDVMGGTYAVEYHKARSHDEKRWAFARARERYPGASASRSPSAVAKSSKLYPDRYEHVK